ncbi:hypothetical protein P5E77_13350 [Clostridium perfringens]|nr:hypothetical protein [Clostridium perfringens]
MNFTYDVFDVNNGFTKEEIINSKNVTAAIFLLDQKITPQEFLERVKAIALFFDGLSTEELKAIKHWIKNTTEDTLAIKATEVLEADKGEVLRMVANNAFIIKEMEENAEKRKAIEIAKNLLDILDDKTISIKTGLTIEEVKKLREES